MQIYFGQIYIEVGVSFPFSHIFQKHLSKEISNRVESSSTFNERYGEDWALMFRISAKRNIDSIEIRGPSKYPKDRDVEYTIFLPYDKIENDPHTLEKALIYLFEGVISVFESIDITTEKLLPVKLELIETILNDKSMFKE